jgi:hypothetical protein
MYFLCNHLNVETHIYYSLKIIFFLKIPSYQCQNIILAFKNYVTYIIIYFMSEYSSECGRIMSIPNKSKKDVYDLILRI